MATDPLMATLPHHPAFGDASDTETSGLTVREYMATQALLGLLASGSFIIGKEALTAVKAVVFADALIAALNK